MKKIILSIMAFAVIFTAIASSGTPTLPTPKNANEIMIPIGNSGKMISLFELSRISKSGLEELTGKQMKGMQKFAFKSAQKKFLKGIDENGNITSKKMRKMFYAGETGFHLGGFALGFLLGLIGVLLAYLVFQDDYKKNRIKWSWIGLAVGVGLSLILIGIALRSSGI